MKRLLLTLLICSFAFSGCGKVEELGTIKPNKEMDFVISEELKKEINEYIDSIYEPGGVLIPSFNDVNLADEHWYWLCAKIKKDLPYIATKEEIESKVKSILGDKAKRKLPIEGIEGEFKPTEDGYIVEIYGGWSESYDYVIDSIKVVDNKIVVEIVEYKHSDFEHDATEVSLFNMNTDEIVTKFDLTLATYLQNRQKAKDFVVRNKDKFTNAIITLEKDESTNDLHIVSLER